MQNQTDEQKEDKQQKEEAQNEEAENKDAEEGEFLHYEGTLSWDYIVNYCWH